VILEDEFGSRWALDLPTGALIGMVNVVDCVPTRTPFDDAAANEADRVCGDFSAGRLPGNAMNFGYSSGLFPIGEHKASSTCPTT
jgi:hypothetical protein